MADATYAMQQVVNYKGGSGHFASALGRPVAGKTGTSDDNRSAWFVGFTPQQVGVVGMYQVGPNGEAEQITPFGGFTQITGGSMPARIWTWMMGPILQDQPVVDFPAARKRRQGKHAFASPTPTPTPSPTPSPKPTPTPEPQAHRRRRSPAPRPCPGRRHCRSCRPRFRWCPRRDGPSHELRNPSGGSHGRSRARTRG